MKNRYLILSVVLLMNIFSVHSQEWNEVGKIVPDSVPLSVNGYYGRYVAIDSNYAAVACPGCKNSYGCVYVLYNNGTTWETIAELTASDGTTYDRFGYSVDISNECVVIGAQCDDDNGTGSGSVYIFEKPDSGWCDMTETLKLTSSKAKEEEFFGRSVGISGNYLVVGAVGSYGLYCGSAYVFKKSDTSWSDITEVAKLRASDEIFINYFGCSVDIFGDCIVVGAYGEDLKRSAGSAYIFEKPDTGWSNMTENAKLTSSDGELLDYFGWDVAIYEDYVVIGALGEYSNSITGGAVYLFEKPDEGWSDMTETSILFQSNNSPDYHIVYSVGISDSYIIAGVLKDEIIELVEGAAYIFEKSDTGWSGIKELTYRTPDDGEINNYFGSSVGISEKNAIVGAYRDDDSGKDMGAVYFYKYGDPRVEITSQPQSIDSICPGTLVHFCITGKNAESYQWQVSCDDGISYSNIEDNEVFSGAITEDLILIATTDYNNNRFRCIAFNPAYSDTSIYATLSLETVSPEICYCPEDYSIYDYSHDVIFMPDYTDSVEAIDNCGDIQIEQDPLKGTELTEGSYEVILNVYDKAGNSVPCSFNIEVITSSSTQTNQESKIRIYPNPVTDIVNLEIEMFSEPVYYKLFSTVGELLAYGKIKDDIVEIDLSGFNSGLYLLQVLYPGEEFYIKIIKE